MTRSKNINCVSCVDCNNCVDCKNCDDCYYCSGQVGKRYMVNNEQLSEEEYFEFINMVRTQKKEKK